MNTARPRFLRDGSLVLLEAGLTATRVASKADDESPLRVRLSLVVDEESARVNRQSPQMMPTTD